MSYDNFNQYMFNTTLAVDAGNVAYSHPSLFQTPAVDNALLNDIDKAKLVNPATIWHTKVLPEKLASTMQSQYTVPFDPKDPPLRKAEKWQMLSKLDPIIDKTLDNVRPTLLFYHFFSKQNFATLQNNIRYAVNKWSGHHVGEQSPLELTLLMEKIYSDHAKNMDEDNAPSKMLLKHIRNEVGRLNELVVNATVPIIVNGLEQHLSYLNMVDNPRSAASLSRPLDTKITGTTVYRSPTDLLASNF